MGAGIKKGRLSAPFEPTLGFLLLSLRRDLQKRRRPIHHRALRHLDLLDILASRKVEHDVSEQLLENGAETASAGAPFEGFLRDGAEGAVLEGELHFLELEQLRVLLGESVLRLFEDCLLYTSDAADERSSVDLGGRRIIKKKK